MNLDITVHLGVMVRQVLFAHKNQYKEPLDYEDIYCPQCGDYDWLIGYADAETREEAWKLLKDDTDIDGSGGWDYNYVQEFINSNWDE